MRFPGASIQLAVDRASLMNSSTSSGDSGQDGGKTPRHLTSTRRAQSQQRQFAAEKRSRLGTRETPLRADLSQHIDGSGMRVRSTASASGDRGRVGREIALANQTGWVTRKCVAETSRTVKRVRMAEVGAILPRSDAPKSRYRGWRRRDTGFADRYRKPIVVATLALAMSLPQLPPFHSVER